MAKATKSQYFTLASAIAIVATLLFWGSVAPRFLLPSSSPVASSEEDAEEAVAELCLWSGTFATTILLGHFAAAYLRSARRGNPFAFVVHWFLASLFFDLVWEIPLWSTKLSSSGPSSIPFLSVDHLWYAIYWWTYSVSDALYVEMTPFVVAAEIWFLLGNLFGGYGLFLCYGSSRRGQSAGPDDKKKMLAAFCICGCLQCYNATLYLFCGWFVEGLVPIHPSLRSQYIYWGLNGCWAVASAVAAQTSWTLLFPTNGSERDKKRE